MSKILNDNKQKIRLLLAKNSNYELCIKEIKKYKLKALSFENECHAAYADYYQAQLHINRGDILKGQQIIKKIIPIFKKHNDNNFLQASYIVMGVVKSELDNLNESLNYLKKATKIKTELKQNQAAAYNNLTSILVELKQYDTAIKKLRQALDLMDLKDLKDRPIYYNLLLNLSRIFLLQNKTKKAFEILQKIKIAQEKYPQDRIEAKLNTNLGNYYVHIKDYDKAHEHYDKGIAYCLKYNFKPILLSIIAKKGEVYIKQNKIEKAEELLLTEYKNYKRENALAYKNIINSLIEIYLLKGNNEERQKYQEELDIICKE